MRAPVRIPTAGEFQLLFDASPTAIAITRLSDGAFRDVNDAFLRLTGYTRQELLGAVGFAPRLWNRPAERAVMLDRLKRDRYARDFVHELRHKSGAVSRAMVSLHVVDWGGEAHVLGFLTNLNELDRTRAALLERDERLRYAEQSAGIGFWEWDAGTRRLNWSTGMEALYGFAEGGFDGRYAEFARHVVAEDLVRYERARDAALASGRPFSLQFRIRRADGARRWLDSRGSATLGPEGVVLRAAGINIDITDIKEQEQRLQLQAEIMNNMAEGVLLVSSANNLIVYANSRFEQMLGYDSGELAGLPLSRINASDERSPEQVASDITAQLRSHGRWRGEIKNRCKDGREIWCRATVSSFDHAEFGAVWVAVHSDFTDARAAQIARDEALGELRRLSSRLQESIEAERSALARDVHDQLGAALTGIRMRLEALAQRTPPESETLRQDLRALARTAQGALISTRTLCSRLRPPALDDLGLRETVRWYLREWAGFSAIQTSGRLERLTVEPDAGSALDLFRILQELLTNVARHSGASRVRVTLSSPRGRICLRVTDNGHGYASTERTSGYGLLGVQERARHHGGRVDIFSSAQGTRVVVTLPTGAS